MTVLKLNPLIAILLSLCFFSACTVVKNPPPNKPFIYQTNVHVQADLKESDKKVLELGLLDQLHDSVKVRSVAKFAGFDKAILGFIPRLFYDVVKVPTVFDSLNAEKTREFMNAYLNAQGYFRDTINYKVRIDTVNKGSELRAYLDFYAYPRVPTLLDSIAYRLNADTAAAAATQKASLDTLQSLTLMNLNAALIKKGDPFSQYQISAERDRLANIYRNNGYLKFSEEEMLVLWDTVGIELLRPTIDPIEQAQLLQQQAERRANPKASIEFRLRENPDSTRIIRYYIGNVTVYPEYATDTLNRYRFSDTVQGFVIKQNLPLFKKKIFPDYIFLNRGDLYRQGNVALTQSKLNLSAWRSLSITPKPRTGQDTVDFDILLTPARKYAFNTSGEISYNNRSNVTIAQGNLIGLAATAGVQNRNFRHGANQSSLNLRFGTELNANIRDIIQTRQLSVGYNVQIPRLVPRFMRVFSRHKENNNATIFSLNAGRTDRRDYFNLATLNASWGYQFNWNNKQLTLRFPNIEYNYLQRGDSLDTLISKNASYKYIFNTGVIVSLPVTFNKAKTVGNVSRIMTVNAELAGVFGLLRNAFATNLYRFGRFDFEHREIRKLSRDAFAWRFFAGFGLGVPFNTQDSANRFLPFFRQYYAGGPNSMRAWSIRKLGPGSALRPFGRTEAPDRFGDARLEMNLEYRKFLTDYRGIGINTALYTDIGNVWFLRDNPDFPGGRIPGTVQKFFKDIAIGLGTGLRVDFGFFKFRLDYAYKVKDPTPDLEKALSQNKWFYGWGLFNGQLQLGIDYPF